MCTEVKMTYKIGDEVEVLISGVQPYGAFASIDKDYSGLIHISEITKGYISDVRNYLTIGDKIMAKIIDVDEEKKHLRLSLKIAGSNRGKIGRKRDFLPPHKLGAKQLLEKIPEMIINKGDWYDQI